MLSSIIKVCNDDTPQRQMENNELGESIMNAIVSLPTKYMTIMDKFLIDQHSHEEISLSMNIPVGTVKASIHRAKEMLRERLSNL